MRSLLILLVICVVPLGTTLSQQVVWDKVVVDYKGHENANAIIKSGAGEYMVAGVFDWSPNYVFSTEYGKWLNFPFGIALTKINDQGDTLWTKITGDQGQIAGMVMGKDSTVYVAWEVYGLPDSTIPRTVIGLSRYDRMGNKISTYWLQTGWPSAPRGVSTTWMPVPQGMYAAENGDLIIYGFHPNGNPNLQYDWFVTRVQPNGRQLWYKTYNPGGYAASAFASSDWNNGILLSGLKNNSIAYMPLDSDGVALDTAKVLIQSDPQHWVTASGAVRMPDGGILSYMNRASNNDNWYNMSRTDATGSLVWDTTFLGFGGSISLRVNQDGSYIHYYGSGNTNYLEKRSSNNQFVWKVAMSGVWNVLYRTYKGIVYLDDESAILVGTSWNRSVGSGADQLFTKIMRVGRPFDPTVLEPDESDGAVYPNPFAHELRAPSGSLVDVLGRPVAAPEQNGILNTTSVPPGLYTLRYFAGGVWKTCRVVRE